MSGRRMTPFPVRQAEHALECADGLPYGLLDKDLHCLVGRVPEPTSGALPQP
ncbi:hypothetical protein [Microbispora hainanensis]|uniref:hypothetical protein n=1 Tax=Microbispora hainanensis TaxID=568844 RepID=UPI001ABFB225|nr:hypothetical protein [Microbispora hainanensis]